MSVRRPFLLPLIPLYRGGLATKNLLLNAGVPKTKKLRWPVISIGSLSAGGAGKTPVTIILAKLLAQRGLNVNVLSRGYGRVSKGTFKVELSGDGLDAARFGDEPVEMAQAGLSVFVGSDRFAVGTLAEAEGGEGVHLLDDGFQHRKLSRAVDIALLTRQDVADSLLPAGNLREPLPALRRAQVVVVREGEGLEALAAASGATVWVIRRKLVLPEPRPLRPVAFCGVARPESFFAMLREAGCPLAGTEVFADHHPYDDADIRRLVAAVRACRADGLITTAKDRVKLSGSDLARLGTVAVARLEVELVDAEAVVDSLLEMITSHPSR